jgi:pyruvate/oxaloacetate carboxyltransferase
MNSEESYAKTFLFYKSASGILDPEMNEDTVKIVKEAVKGKVQVNLIINNRAGINASPIAEKIVDRLNKENQQTLF